jgi:hypothetical protein
MNGHSTPKVQPATSHVKILEEYFSQVPILLIAIRVTRLGEIRPSGDSLLGAVILKITEIAHILGRSVFPRLGSCIISEKTVLGYHFGLFFSINSSGHPYRHCG